MRPPCRYRRHAAAARPAPILSSSCHPVPTYQGLPGGRAAGCRVAWDTTGVVGRPSAVRVASQNAFRVPNGAHLKVVAEQQARALAAQDELQMRLIRVNRPHGESAADEFVDPARRGLTASRLRQSDPVQSLPWHRLPASGPAKATAERFAHICAVRRAAALRLRFPRAHAPRRGGGGIAVGLLRGGKGAR